MATYEYKFRAECENDIETFKIENFNRIKELRTIRWKGYPDAEFEFESDLSLDELISILNKIPDGHVMAETVNLKTFYTGERIYQLNN